MAEWKKVVVSGSSAELAGLTVDNQITGDISGNAGGNAATATQLETSRNIGGVAFDGTANIDLPGVNSAGNQSTTGNAATATQLETPRQINGTEFDGTTNITITAAGSTLSDTVPVSKGGTGLTTVADKSLIFTSATDTFSALTAGVADDGKVVAYNNSTGNYELVTTGSGDVTEVTSATTDQLTVTNGTGPIPSLSIVTAAIANAGTGLATADQIHTFVTTQTDEIAADTSGNAATAAALQASVSIGGVEFDGSANIDLPGVNSAGNQDTSGTAAAADSLSAGASGTDLTLSGDLTVQGTASFESTENLKVTDRFIALASGSAGASDGGIVIEQSSVGGGKGAVFAWDGIGTSRWGISTDFNPTASAYTPDAFMAAAVVSTSDDPETAVDNAYKKAGNIYVDTNLGEAYIYV